MAAWNQTEMRCGADDFVVANADVDGDSDGDEDDGDCGCRSAGCCYHLAIRSCTWLASPALYSCCAAAAPDPEKWIQRRL